eukprot:CAMPEP_0181201500 /NCGR_PEP_ID=MMETSP1096-20121128/18341_1 /TAXON_ID=156174 ORGANISM="Chrysochromulina ericina, Strain CCMP281" /NCGR_SAMPLE_ID=MMETSP1096 /ASSEMBLY_ACC=CAM_ASM_000453 /LENGTH=71 /DNA_ID=CAMNT_0023291949 /DNA_START=563 /DNA_END=775 /DNA_ORIENTATION=+
MCAGVHPPPPPPRTSSAADAKPHLHVIHPDLLYDPFKDGPHKCSSDPTSARPTTSARPHECSSDPTSARPT